MRNIILVVCLLGSLLISPFSSFAQEEPAPVSDKMKQSVVDSIAAKYSDWSHLTISGKLSSPLLPISANVKIYMEKDKVTLISVSAMFVGEVARIEVDKDAVLIVNKYNKKYIRYTLDEFRELYPGGQEELQNILLGRVAIMGKGQLKSKDSSALEIYDTQPQNWVLIPNSDFQQPGLVYLYSVAKGSLDISRFIVVSEDGRSEMACDYEWNKKGEMTVDMEALVANKAYAGNLKLNAPTKDKSSFDRIKLDSKYTKVSSFKQLMK